MIGISNILHSNRAFIKSFLGNLRWRRLFPPELPATASGPTAAESTPATGGAVSLPAGLNHRLCHPLHREKQIPGAPSCSVDSERVTGLNVQGAAGETAQDAAGQAGGDADPRIIGDARWAATHVGVLCNEGPERDPGRVRIYPRRWKTSKEDSNE